MDQLQYHQVTALFKDTDRDNKGYLTKEDYKVAVIKLFGYKPSKFEITTTFNNNNNNNLTLQQFIDVIHPRLKEQDSSEEIRKIFMAFDRFCHGFISQEDCIAAFDKILPLMPHERVASFFHEIDGDLDGRVSYRDFDLMFKQLASTQ
jgi:Ca2+-binding EF-hand superfamily protein